MKHLRYYSEFRSRRNALYRVEIWQDSATAFTPKSIVLSGDPVEIEWSDADKLEPVHSSSATLNMISMSDREFADLYAVEVNAVRLDIYRNKTLYWSGSLDPEIFEEPYSYKDRYITSVTFSDFAILDRLNWEGRGIYSVGQVIDTCLSSAGFKFSELAQDISTKIAVSDAAPMNINDLFIIGENFYDEDNETMTMREVLDETLRPFALRVVQKNGRIHLYDLNAIHAHEAQKVVWRSTDANMEADVVYNNVKVTFSPYANAALIDGTLDFETLLKDVPATTSITFKVDNSASSPDGFTVEYENGSGIADRPFGPLIVHNEARACRIKAAYSGSDEAVIMWKFNYGDAQHGKDFNNVPVTTGDDGPKTSIIQTKRTFLPRCAEPTASCMLRISLDVLIDVRNNPFEAAESGNYASNYGRLKEWANYSYIPIGLFLVDGDGKYKYHYSNIDAVNSRGYGESGNWVRTENVYQKGYHLGDAYLSYYDDDRKSNTGLGGWKTNRQTIGWHSGTLPTLMKKLNAGMYIAPPPEAGHIELHIGANAAMLDNDTDRWRAVASMIRWVLYKNPKVEVVKSNGLSIDKEDVEDSAWINKSAKEGLTIDTVFGTMPEAVPSARGLIFDASGQVFRQFSRAEHTDRLERLLIGTVYSQYASRKHILSGTVKLLPEFGVLTDVSEPGQYLLVNEVQHLAREESEIKMVQFEADNYESIESK